MTDIVFMGSAEFSVPPLLALTMTYNLVGVVTQPDRPAGRGRKLEANPVKRLAEVSGVEILQPTTLRDAEVVSHLADWQADLFVVAAFGHILPQTVLDLPPDGCLNIHASLLPRWRGAAPIPAAILAGDTETGVTIMKMDTGMDTGPLLDQQSTRIEVDDTAATLSPRLAEMGAQLLVETLPEYLSGELIPRPQPAEGVTYAPQLKKQDGLIDWTRPALQINRQARAYTPWPGAFTFWKGKSLKVLEALVLTDWRGPQPPGTVMKGQVCPLVATGEGALWVTRLQLEGKKAMSSDAFICGQPDFVGSVLG